MKVDDLVFETADCCGIHLTTTIKIDDKTDLGIIAGDDGTYSVTFYKNGGLWKRECCVSKNQLQELIS